MSSLPADLRTDFRHSVILYFKPQIIINMIKVRFLDMYCY